MTPLQLLRAERRRRWWIDPPGRVRGLRGAARFVDAVGFAFLWFGPTTWEPFAAAGLLLVCHFGSASVAEPMIIGNAVGVSPLVVLGSLAEKSPYPSSHPLGLPH